MSVFQTVETEARDMSPSVEALVGVGSREARRMTKTSVVLGTVLFI